MGEAGSITRRAALGGLVGPAAFVGAWAVGGLSTARAYSPVHDAISRLAAVGADSRPLMTAGFVASGGAVPTYSLALRRVVAGPAWLAAAATGVATLGVAALPLDRSPRIDTWHGVAAGLGYVTLAATPLLAARPLLAHGLRSLGWSGVAAGITSAVALALTTTGVPHGLFQRIGLSASDAWLVASAVAIATGRLVPAAPASFRP